MLPSGDLREAEQKSRCGRGPASQLGRHCAEGGFPLGPGLHIIVQNFDWPVSRETSSLFLSRTKMASFPYCAYHMLRLLLRYVPGGPDSSFCCCCCQTSREVSRYRSRAKPSDRAFSASGTRLLIAGPAPPAPQAPAASCQLL